MQLSQTTSMRMEQRQLLTPRMIQSMEILQLPLMALEERIEQELSANPVLELRERRADAPSVNGATPEGERPLVVDEKSADEFRRLDRIGDYLENEEFSTNGAGGMRKGGLVDGERDRKLDALGNAPDRGINLAEHLLEQWRFVECSAGVRRAGEVLIEHIDADGYLRVPLDQVAAAAPDLIASDDLNEALRLVQTLEPAGVGARELSECLLLQLDAIEQDPDLSEGHDFDLERALVRDHLNDLRMNRYPQISRRLARDIDDLKRAVRQLGRLHPHPGRQFASDEAQPVHPDAIVYFDEETDRYEIRMTRDPTADLRLSGVWRRYLKDRKGDRKTREFLNQHLRNARWLIDAIQQRQSTIQRVIRVVVDAQREFLDQGPEFLRPLPMIQVAEQLGVHVATVSRAVSEKWIQTPRGVYPLRRFFSGGTQSSDGEDMSWDAVKEKLRAIIAAEDRSNPLNDDEIVQKLKDQGIDLARRTVAKYRKLLHIPTARQRREF